MMIALAILALGLLVIGAALPVGLRYTRESVNIATGQAAAEHALDLIAQNVCLPRTILTLGVLSREPGLFQPRGAATGDFDPNYEPVIKVRPLYTQNVNATPRSSYYGAQDDRINVFNWPGVLVEDAIRTWLGMDQPEECGNASAAQWLRWALPSTALVYPPASPSGGQVGFETYVQYVPTMFLPSSGNQYARYPLAAGDTRKVLDSLISWAAFYRRVSYDDPNSPTINEGDPTLYEFIAIAVRRPSVRHRFPVQHPSDGGLDRVASRLAVDSAVPIPWLVSFTSLPVPPGGGFDPATGFPITYGQNPATLSFYCDSSLSSLFSVGSIFIPARNDVHPSTTMLTPVDYVSFGPPAPNTLPIYEVVQRPNESTVVVKYNGYYPRQGTSSPSIPSYWPVWVIPPAYEEGLSTNPILPDRSPILAVARRYVRLREITP
jgi:hypothetical protein